MNVTTVDMDAEAAEKAFEEYRAAFRESGERIDGEIMRTYKALSEGKKVIRLTEAIQAGGLDEIGRPNIAIARADERSISMRIWVDGNITYRPDWTARSEDRVFTFPEATLVPPRTNADRPWMEPWVGDWVASTPFIPPAYRPPYRLENYHLLWEAEWRRARGSQRRDPMLLRRVGGELFAVVAAWDLTEVEKLALAR